MEYLRGYRVVFADPEWVGKVAVAGLLFLSAMCVPILGQIVVSGWAVESTKRNLRGEPGLPPIPLSLDGLKPFVEPGIRHFLVQLAYTLPVVGVMMPIMICVPAGSGFLVQRGGEDAAAVAGGFFLCAFPIFFGLILAMNLFATYAQLRVAITSEVGKAFEFSAILGGVKRILPELVVGSIAVGLVAGLLQFVGVLACFFGAFFTIAISMSAAAIFHADLARLDAERGGPPLPNTFVTNVADTFR